MTGKMFFALSILCAASILPAETVSASSAPFSFSGATGVVAGQTPTAGAALRYRAMGKGRICVSWRMDRSFGPGTLVLTALNGAVVRRLAITGPAGSVILGPQENGAGIYLAAFSNDKEHLAMTVVAQ